jgi:hypothetical protein
LLLFDAQPSENGLALKNKTVCAPAYRLFVRFQKYEQRTVLCIFGEFHEGRQVFCYLPKK